MEYYKLLKDTPNVYAGAVVRLYSRATSTYELTDRVWLIDPEAHEDGSSTRFKVTKTAIDNGWFTPVWRVVKDGQTVYVDQETARKLADATYAGEKVK